MYYIIKTAGIMIFFFSSTAFGFLKAAAAEKRLKELKKIYASLGSLKIYISHIPEETETIYKKCFAECDSIKIESGKMLCEGSVLSESDKGILNDFFSEFGSKSAEDEISRTELCIGLISKKIEEATLKISQKSKIWRVCGISVGLCGAIMLI